MTNVPNLRFNNFNDKWQEHVLGDIFEFYTTNSFSRDFLDNDNGSVKNIHYGDIHMKFPTILDVKNNGIPYVKETVDLSKISIEAYCKNGDVVIADASEDYNDIGKAIELKNVGEEKLLAGLHTILARDSKQVMVNGFRGYLMSSPNVRKQIKVYAAGAKVLGISKANISKVNLLIPSSIEQEKIASLFSLIDKKIELQTEKVEELKNYKKGIMQKIFSQELRFKDENGNEYPEWEEKLLGNITDIGTGSNDLQDKVEDGKYPFFVRSANIERINNYTFDGEAILIPGDGNIGQIYHYINGKFAYHQRVYKISDFIDGVSGKYIYYYLTRFFLKEALKNSVKATVDSLRLPTLIRMKVLLPCTKEQEKITKVLSALDCKIEKEQAKLDTLNDYKKGLLQQMFV